MDTLHYVGFDMPPNNVCHLMFYSTEYIYTGCGAGDDLF